MYIERGVCIYVYIYNTQQDMIKIIKERDVKGVVYREERFFQGIFRKVSLRKCHLMRTIFFMSWEGIKGTIPTERPSAKFRRYKEAGQI